MFGFASGFTVIIYNLAHQRALEVAVDSEMLLGIQDKENK